MSGYEQLDDVTFRRIAGVRQLLSGEELDAWPKLCGLVDIAVVEGGLVEGARSEALRLLLKLCWVYMRYGALHERYSTSHPFLSDLESMQVRFDDLSMTKVDMEGGVH